MSKIIDFFILVIAVLAAIGGTAYLFYDHHILFGIANLCLAAMAFPFLKERYKDMIA